MDKKFVSCHVSYSDGTGEWLSEEDATKLTKKIDDDNGLNGPFVQVPVSVMLKIYDAFVRATRLGQWDISLDDYLKATVEERALKSKIFSIGEFGSWDAGNYLTQEQKNGIQKNV